MKPISNIQNLLLAVTLTVSLSSCYTSSVGFQYSSPSWAIDNQNGVRYYYLPDIEAYYDLSNENFVYLDNGQWIFSAMPPRMYAGFDLFNGFYVALDINVFQPWMHHQYYLYHYPRYYYQNIYQGNAFHNIRGFNENQRKPIYWRNDERDRINNLKRGGFTEKKREPRIQPQKPNYYGRDLGQPVKVRPNMRKNSNISRPPTVTKPGGSRGPR